MPNTNSALMMALRKKLGSADRPVSPQAVQQRRAKLQAIVPMPSDIATYVVALREGVRLHTYLDAETLDKVATAEQRLAAKEASAGTAPVRPPVARRAAGKAVKQLILGTVRLPESALSERRRQEVERMAGVYPLLYAFENSVREFVDGHLTARYGADWWEDSKLVSGNIRRTVERNKTAEGQHRYHSRRNARPIYYTNLADLGAIAMSENGWLVFRGIFPSDKWLPALIEKVEASRNVVAHMNPLQQRDIDRIKLSFHDWLEQIKGHEAEVAP